MADPKRHALGSLGGIVPSPPYDAEALASIPPDIQTYWPLLKPSILFGDDDSESRPGMIKTVNRFAAETALKLWAADEK